MESETTSRLKDVELAILKAFIKCCETLGIKYYLLGGSMLGAVRHKGFIPWDDDIDVGMPRHDYECFLSKGQSLLPDYYFIQTKDTDHNVLLNYSKIRDSRTTFIETSVKNHNINHGVYIDVFPLDYYPEDDKEQKRFNRKRRILGWRIRNEFSLSKENKGTIVQELYRKLAWQILKIKYPTEREAIEEREQLYKSIQRSRLVANYSGAWGKKEIVPEEWYGEGIITEFENVSVRIPTEYDKWLTQVYGNYMELPPPGKRVSHHYTEIVDLDKSYIEYISDERRN